MQHVASPTDIMHAQDDVLFVIYTLPTVVISRRTDQYGKVRFAPHACSTPGQPRRHPQTDAYNHTGCVSARSMSSKLS